jgi:tetratricopeptide (TPR) repeat protein
MSSRDPAAARYPVINKATQGVNLLPFSLSAGVDMLFGLLSGEVDSLDSSEDTAGRDPEEMKLAEELVKQLGGLPLALNQTANYMLEAECDLREFSELFFDYQNRSTLLDQDPGHMHMSYPHSLKTVWDISMTRVDQGNTNSRHLLQILSLFDPDGIPEDLLDGPKGQRSPLPPSLSYLRNKIGYLNTVKPLLQQSMITKNKASQTISIHRLVSAITVSKISPGDRQTRFEEAVELLYRVYPQLSVKKASLNEDWRDCRLYIAQVTALEKCYRESDSPLLPVAKFATLLANASWFLFEQGLPSQSMQLLPTARAVGEATSAGNELAVSTIYRCSGGIYLDVNKPEAAFDNFNWQMTIMESLEGGSGLAVAAGLSNCALAKLSMGDYAESRKYIERAQEIRDRYPGQALSYRALTIDVLGILDGLEGNTDGALRNINEAIKLYDEELGYGNYLTVL